MKKIFVIGLATAAALASIIVTPVNVFANQTEVIRERFGQQLEAGTYETLFYDEFVNSYIYEDGDKGNTDNDYTGLAKPVTNSGIIEVKNIASAPIDLGNKDVMTVVNAETGRLAEQYSKDIRAAFDAFVKDYPEVFWINKVDYKCNFSASISKNKLTIKTDITITPTAYENGMLKDIKAFNDAVLAAEIEIGDDYNVANTDELVTGVFAYVANAIDYNYGVKESRNYTALPVFVDKYGKLGVCECYSKAVKILLDRYGVNNILVIGTYVDAAGTPESHMWNNVEVNDNWYLVDATMGDQSSGLYFNYILAGQNTVGYGNTVKDDHIPTNYFSGYDNSKYFELPKLAVEAYKLNKISGITYNYADFNTNKDAIEIPVEASTQNMAMSRMARSNTAAVEKNTAAAATKSTVETNKTTKKVVKKVVKTNIVKAKFSKVKVQKYKKGKAVKPAVTIKYNKKTLKAGKDYCVKYKNNKKKGTATMTITGIGSFRGTKTIKFKIK